MQFSRRGFLGLVLLAGASLGGSVALAAVVDGSPPGLARAMGVQDAHSDVLMAVPGVAGTATGVRGDGRAAVVIFTEHASVGGLPQTLDGVPVIVRVSGKFYPRHHRPGHTKGGDDGTGDPPPDSGGCPDDTTAKSRPACIGTSTGHPDITAGTIGVRVTDSGGGVYALSNNHVYADENRAARGDAVIQPGAFDGGTSLSDDIGTLHEYEPIVFSQLAANLMDAAIAMTTADQLGQSTPPFGYGVPCTQTVGAVINMKVKKVGRTTGQTEGSVYALNATVDVSYDAGVARFVDQIIITPGNFSAGGDSGSLVVASGKGRNRNIDRKPVGLLFAGSNLFTIANPIGPVLQRFGVTIDGDSC